ncbi:MAG: hypothetical protein WCD66_04515 [Rhodanobacteraceae bacterium]
MILRRIADHLKQQHWTGVFIELVIVILGVFIGMQVQDWNAARIARTELNQQLISLRMQLEDNRAYFKDFRAQLVGQQHDVKALRSAFKKDPPTISGKELNQRFVNVNRIYVFAPDLTALNELTDTGGLRRIENPKIRDAIGRWQRDLDDVNRLYSDALRQRDGVWNRFMMKNLAFGALLEQSDIVGNEVGVSKFRNDIAALASSREVDNELAYRYGICGAEVHALDALDRETARLISLLVKRGQAS